MIKTLNQVLSDDRESFRIPRSVQDTVPVRRVYADGVFRVGNKYSKTFRFTDVNYSVASGDDKQSMFLDYCELINALEVGATTKITISNRRQSRAGFQDNLLPLRKDGLDGYRSEYNAMLMDNALSGSGIVQEKYITVSVHKNSYEEARTFFTRVATELSGRFSKLSSRCIELDAQERLRIFHDFFRAGQEEMFCFDMPLSMRHGHSFKEAICPESMSVAADHIKMGNIYARALYLREYPSYLKDSMVSEMCDINRNLMFSIDIIPVPTDEAVKEVESRLLGTETDITNWQRKQNRNNNFSAVVPYDLEQQRQESKEFLDDLTTRDQRMMFAVVTLVHAADSLEQLNTDTEALLAVGRKHICSFDVLKYQQLQGLNTALPYGLRKIDALRTLTTESTAVLTPFRAQEINHENGVFCGRNAISKNLIFVNRGELLNGNGFILGVSGSGKSFFAKRDIVSLALKGDCDILIIDPESEYGSLVSGLGGEVIRIAADSASHINALDLPEEAGESENPVVLKSEFMLSLCEQLVGSGRLTAREKSLIDRCTPLVYKDYL